MTVCITIVLSGAIRRNSVGDMSNQAGGKTEPTVQARKPIFLFSRNCDYYAIEKENEIK